METQAKSLLALMFPDSLSKRLISQLLTHIYFCSDFVRLNIEPDGLNRLLDFLVEFSAFIVGQK
jgi:hypothetical protein